MAGDVIAVGAPGPSLQKRRGIAVGNAQRLQIGHDVQGIPEREPGVKLQTIGRFGQTGAWRRCPWLRLPIRLEYGPAWVPLAQDKASQGVCCASSCSGLVRRTDHRAALQRIRLLAAEEQGLAWHIDGIEEALPLLSRLDRGQREGNRFVMGIEEEQNGVTDNRFPTLVHIPDEIAGQPHPKAAGISGIPRVFRHVLAGGVKPRDILDPLAINRTAQEKLAALKDRLGAPDLQHGAHKVAEGLLLIGQRSQLSQVSSLSWQ